LVQTQYAVVNIAYKTLLFTIYITLMIKRDFPLRSIPVVNKFFKESDK